MTSVRLFRTAVAAWITVVSLAAQTPARDGLIRAVPFADVKLLRGFWSGYDVSTQRTSAEICADTGLEEWSHGMFRADGDGKHVDLLEHALYNGGFSQASLACRPVNPARTIAQLPGLIYAQNDTTLFVGLFAASEARTRIGAVPVRVTQRTNYPWDGEIELRIEPDRRSIFTVAVRIPGWARGQPAVADLYRFHQPDVPAPTLIVNGQAVRAMLDRGFARVTREWRSGDVMHVYFPMPVHRVLPNAPVEETRDRAALQRGPLVYGQEQIDGEARLAERVVPLDTAFEHTFRQDLLGGVEALAASNLLAVPYYAWANRGRGRIAVWLRYR